MAGTKRIENEEDNKEVVIVRGGTRMFRIVGDRGSPRYLFVWAV